MRILGNTIPPGELSPSSRTGGDSIMNLVGRMRAVLGAPVRRRLRKDACRFLAQTSRCREVQREVLARLIRLNAESEFSREHRLVDVHTVDDFRSRLPVGDYETHRPWIERLKQGDHAALLGPSNRLLMFTLSSGTTSESKFIPITEQFLRDYRNGWQNWGILAYDDHPAATIKTIVQLSSDHCRFYTQGGTPCGNISGLAQAMQNPIVRTMYTVPGCVSKISDPETKSYVVLRLMLADPHIGMVTTANPSTLIQLAKLGDRRKAELICDVADGTLAVRDRCEPDVLPRLSRRLRARPDRARRLDAIVEATGSLYPRDYCDELDVVAVWTGGSCGAYLGALRELFGPAAFRDHGLSASEGRMTIPLGDEDNAGVLDVGTHFFEFIPEEEHESEHPTVLEAHELQREQNYFILLTTSSGLYRYDIRDVVRCVGFYGTTPLLTFLHKGAHVANITGEKLSESQIVQAVNAAAADTRLECFTVLPTWGDPPGYSIAIEEPEHRLLQTIDAFSAAVDSHLRQANCEYEEKRRTGRLAPIRCAPVRPGTWDAFSRERTCRAGGSTEQYKHPCLLPTLAQAEEFLAKYGLPSGSPQT
jgi:hypothetical protein